MQFTVSVTINKGIDEVVAKWQDPENLKHWQEGFLGHEFIDGEPGAVGSKTKLRYMMRGKEFDMTETIRVNDLPREFSAFYEHIHMDNEMRNTFTAVDENTTRWDSHIHYVVMRKFIVKVLMKLFPGMAKKQTQKWLDNFKNFCETGASIVE